MYVKAKETIHHLERILFGHWAPNSKIIFHEWGGKGWGGNGRGGEERGGVGRGGVYKKM